MAQINLTVGEAALGRLKELFLAVEGACEAWADDEVVRRILIRGAMEYAKSAGRPWVEVQAVSKDLRAALS